MSGKNNFDHAEFTRLLRGEKGSITQLINEQNKYEKEMDSLEEWDTEYYRKIYGDGFLEEIVNTLGIIKNEDRMQMASMILIAADEYMSEKNLQDTKMNVSDYIQHMRRLKTSSEKLFKEFCSLINDFEDTTGHKFWFFLQYKEALKKEYEEHGTGRNPYIDVMLKHHPSSHILLDEFFEMMARAAASEIKNPRIKTPEYNNPLDVWLNYIVSGWKEYSSLELTAGKYYDKNIGYVSFSLDILIKIISVVDPGITNVTLGNALKKILKEGKERESRNKK